MIESTDAEQTITIQDNRGNFAELNGRYDVDGTIVLTVSATDGVVFSTLALALVNFASGLVDDTETSRLLDTAVGRLLDHCVSLVDLKQNGQPVNQDDYPF
jgi:hypothetical protein